MKTRTNVLFRIFQLLVFAWAMYFLYHKLDGKIHWSDFNFSLQAPEFWIILFLMPVNWFLESVKWKFLCRDITSLSLGKCMRSILMGTFFTLFTPNRIGDGAGRIALLPKGNKTRGSWAFLNGSVAQTLVTLAFGSIALALFPAYLQPEDQEHWRILEWARWPIWVLSVLLLLLYVEPGWLRMAQEFTKEDSWIGKRIRTLQEYSRRQNAVTFLLSTLRYAVFSTQFWLALQLFGYEGEPVEAFMRISIIYVATTLIPTAAAAELGLRESMAVLLLPAGGMLATTAFTSTLFLWGINLLLPGIIGAYFFLTSKKEKES